jgi:ribosome-associated translation inhibitor RaiA
MSENEKSYNFEFEFQSKLGDISNLEDKLRDEAETRLLKLARGHTDLTGASIIIENTDMQAPTPYRYRARIVAYTKPEYVDSTKEADSAIAAMKGALDAVERQVRETRAKIRDRHRQPKEE